MASASTSEVKSTSELKYDLSQLRKGLKYLRAKFYNYENISSRNVDTSLICELVVDSTSYSVIFERSAMVAAPYGQVYCWDVISGQRLWDITTGTGIYDEYLNLEDGHHSYRADLAFYERYRNKVMEELSYGAEELIRELQEVSHDRSLSVSVKTTVFSLDPQTGMVISTFKSDEDSSSDDNPQIPSKYLDGTVELIYVKRTDYDLTYYSLPTGNLLWHLRFAEFEASSKCDCDYCLGKIETTQAKLLHQIHNNVGQVYQPSEFTKFLTRNNIHLPFENHHSEATDSKTTSDHLNSGLHVGKLFLPEKQIGKGTNNTTFLEGTYDGRPATVKRISRVDGVDYVLDKNRYGFDYLGYDNKCYGIEKDPQFVYYAFEPCICSLQELILGQSDSAETMTRINGFKSMNDDGYPSPELFALVREIAYQLADIHTWGRSLGDLKPQSIMIYEGNSSRPFTVELGPGFKIEKDNDSEDREKDMLDFGRLLLYCFSGGRNFYGNVSTLDMKIVFSNIYGPMRENIPEAYDLIYKLMQSDPKMRLTTGDLCYHYLLWDPSTRLEFLCQACQHLPLDRELKDMGILCFDGTWDIKLHTEVLSHLNRYIVCKTDSVYYMLLAIRTIADHFPDLPKEVRGVLGENKTGVEYYFTSRFPKLFMGVHKVLRKYRDDYEGPFWPFDYHNTPSSSG